MRKPVIAVADSPFPSLDPMTAALARLDPELRLAACAAPEDILAVARDADVLSSTECGSASNCDPAPFVG